MRISELLNLQAIDVNASVGSKAEAIDYMTRLMEKSGNLKDREAYKKGVLAREEEGTTGIGEGIAIPHAKCDAVKRAGIGGIPARSYLRASSGKGRQQRRHIRGF